MKSLVVTLALLFGSTGCFTTWVGLRASGHAGAPDESVREERVPQPGIQERLVVTLQRASSKFECKAEQRATDAVYHSAYRYGSGWKKAVVLMFVAEALVATVLYVGKPDDPAHIAGAGFFALDAVGTGALFFAPRKEIYRSETEPVTTTIREVCPEGLAVEIAGETYSIDASGAVGELGAAALEDWMRTPDGSLLIDFQGRTSELRSDATLFAATFDVPAGTLARVALP
ncbi:MAG TPA: hypothetical protein VLB44_15415 [Kofleriaceae bacterium]|nr:hypothetical protein [Kofleriaceae bacterium]